MEQRLRLDIPTLADPVVHDLLQESDLFVRSFNGMGGFGLLSPFDFVHILSLISELFAHLWVLMSLTGGAEHIAALGISLVSALLPLLLRWCGLSQIMSENHSSRQEARTAERQEKLRNLAYSDYHRPEIILFGLGPWILRSWATARKSMLGAEQRSTPIRESGMPDFLAQVNISDLLFALQNVGRLHSVFVFEFLSHCVYADPISHDSAILVSVIGLVSSVQKLYPVRRVHGHESSYYHTDGLPRRLLDGRILCGYENSTPVETPQREYGAVPTFTTRRADTS